MTDQSTPLNDINESLKGGYVLVDLSISRWEDKKPDEALARELATAHGGVAEMFAATKKLMAGCQEYKDLNSTLNAMRTYIYAHSLPWSMAGAGRAKKGPRLVDTGGVMQIIADLKKMQDEADAAVLALQAVWPTRVSEALVKQGTAGDATQYPDASELRDLFTISVDIEPVPTVGDFSRMAIPAKLAEALGNRMAKRQNAAVENAMSDLTGRIVTSVGNMAKQLHKHADGGKTRLYTSLVDNVKTLLGMLRTANLTDDPMLAEVADMMDALVVHDIKAIKNSVGTAKELATKADAIVKRVQADTPDVTPEVTLTPEPPMEMGTQKIPAPEPEPELDLTPVVIETDDDEDNAVWY